MIFTIIRNRNEAREEFEKFISKSVEILAGDEMKMNIHKDKMLWYIQSTVLGLLMREAEI